MKKLMFFVAVLPLIAFSCVKQAAFETEAPLENSVIDPWLAKPVEVKFIPGPKTTVRAGFEETKSHLSVDESTKFATVVWDKDDSFLMAGYSSGWYVASYTAVASGTDVEFTTKYGMPTGVTLHSIYAPLNGKSSGGISVSSDPDFGFGLKLPSEQTATAGGIAQGLNFAYAQSSNTEDHLTFHNILALVRFKMTGALASSVTSVTLNGTAPLAGDFVFVPNASGIPETTFSKSFVGDSHSSTLTLGNGGSSLSADTYYYFAVVPGNHSAFSLVFSDGSGSTTKTSTNAASFERGKITDIGTIDLGSSWADTFDNSPIKYIEATAGAPKPVTIAVVPDGFTQAEMDNYEMLAKSAMDKLFSVEPYKSYKEYFNVYILKVASFESGARISDGTEAEQNRNCYFKSTWGKDSYSDMDADAETIWSFIQNNCPDVVNGINSVNDVPVLLIINDNRYGGRCMSYSTGWGYCLAPYSYAGGNMSWPYPNYEAVSDSDPSAGITATSSERYAEVGTNTGTWLNTMIHEFGGHCFGRLGDEYWYDTYDGPTASISSHTWTAPFGLNISATYSNPGWQFMLDKKEMLVASDSRYGRLGVFQGGDVSILNRWRSERISCMIDNRAYFSTFQRYLIVQRIATLAGTTIDEATFWAKDDPTDPVRDTGGSSVMGYKDPVTPRPVGPLAPPKLIEVD